LRETPSVESRHFVDSALHVFNAIALSVYICLLTTTILRPFLRDHPGEPVPEESFFCFLWCYGG